MKDTVKLIAIIFLIAFTLIVLWIAVSNPEPQSNDCRMIPAGKVFLTRCD